MSTGLTSNPVGRYLTSTKNLAGSMLGIAGLAVHFVLPALVGPVWPIVVVGLYGVGAFAAPSSQPEAPTLAAPVDIGSISKACDSVLHLAHDVPPDVMTEVKAITDSIRTLLPNLSGAPPGSEDVYVLSRMATSYLPDTLQAYLRLPRQYAETRALSNGQTAHQMVIRQLKLLQQKMSDVTDAILKGDSDALAAHGQFLEDRFKPSALQVAPSAGQAPPSA